MNEKIFEVISAGVICVDREFRIIEHNRLGARSIGADEAQDLTGQLFFELTKNNENGLKVAFEKVLAEKKPLSFWGCPVLNSETGEKIFWDYTVNEFEGGVVLSAVEVTSRVETERTLQNSIEQARQSADKLQAVVQQMADGVIVCDVSGRVTKINEAASAMLGDAVEVLKSGAGKAQKSSDLIRKSNGEEYPTAEYPWCLAHEKGELSIDTEMLVKPSAEGREVILSVSSAPLYDNDAQLVGAVTVLRDVTENRHLISDLYDANRQLEEYNRLKAEFVANMSHELRTPLTAIIGFAQLMQIKAEKGGQKMPEVIHDGLERILRNGRHLLTLIDEVLDLSKIEAGRLTLHLDHFDPSELVEKTFGGLESLALEKRLEYNLKISEDFPVAFSDPARIRQILLNLLSNAIKFTERGAVKVEIRQPDEKRWQIVVKDSGVGINSENLNSIFERFRQVDGSYTRTQGGFGLGLSISQQLANLLGGEITVNSEFGKGSEFILTLPFNAPKAVLTLDTQRSEAEERGEYKTLDEVERGKDLRDEDDHRQLVLVIDDIADSTELLSHTLESAGYCVRVAHSGAEGLQMARRLLPDAVTLDIMMPGMDGWRVLKEMKADAQLSKIPVIVVSIVDNKPLGYRLGASNYLVKPFEPDALLNTLNAVVSAPDDLSVGDYVLVVDDEQGVRELIIAALMQAGFKTRSAASGEIAFDLSLKNPPLAIMTDLHMPGGMSGYELIARLRTQKATARTPIVVITGKDLLTDDREFISGQIADVIRKGDLLLSDLDERLRETLAEIGVKPTNGNNNAG